MEVFSAILHQRIIWKRRSVEYNLSELTHALVYFIGQERNLKYVLDEVVEDIIKDCEIYYEMERYKVIDCIKELGNLAAVYAKEDEDEKIYLSICKNIERLRVSYPVN